MYKHLIATSIFFLCLAQLAMAQAVYQKGTPYTYANQLKSAVPTETMPNIDLVKLQAEDEKGDKGRQAYRIGFLHKVNYSLQNAGKWEELPNGDRIWRLHIVAPDALTINLNYSKYNIPHSGKLFVYSTSDKESVLGPFTSMNEKINGRFATGFTRGQECIIEYYEPKSAAGKGEIVIDGVVHGYRSLPNPKDEFFKAFRDSGSCNYDVECAIGDEWRDQIKSVGMHLLSNGTRVCTGALISNTGNDCKPYFLTANHCFGLSPGTIIDDIFMFNYDSPSPSCPGKANADGPTDQTIQGAKVIANSADSDFFLIELSTNPKDFYDVYFSGWDRRTDANVSAVSIHHPSADVKKISFDEDPPSTDGNFWEVVWENGTTEGGSSGSPLFNQDKRIIGQLLGGNAACSVPNGSDVYGKVDVSWDNETFPTQQLKPWLDPLGSDAMFIDGTGCNSPVQPIAKFFPADSTNVTFCGSSSISFSDQSIGLPSEWSWTFSGADVSPESSTAQNPTVTVSSSGSLTAMLVVSNMLATDTITQNYNVIIASCTTSTICDTPDLNIPDNNATGASSNLNVLEKGIIADINVEVDITHTYVGDLSIELSHDGVTVTVLASSGCNRRNIDAIFDDEASQSPQCGSNPAYGGTVTPLEPLSTFQGMDQEGPWTIKVIDSFGQDIGTLNEWCLEISKRKRRRRFINLRDK